MKRCNYQGCGSYAFNLSRDGIDQRDLCDVHYWQSKAKTARRDALEDAANKFDGTTTYNPLAADGYSNASDIASELRYMATEELLWE
jgi:hypothetical protein